MIKLTKETWAFGPTDTKVHLYYPTNGPSTRRLCRRHRALVAELIESDDQRADCRMCLNIRNLIPNQGKWGVPK